MLALIRSLIPPFASLLLMMIASGFFTTFVSIRLDLEGVGPTLIGVVTSSLYVGILIGSLVMDRWIISIGHIRSFVMLAALLICVCLLQSFWVNAWFWAALRLLGGICSAGIFILIESWLLIQSANHLRGGILSVYLGVFYGGVALGQLMIDITDPLGLFPFIITSFFVALSILPISYRKITEPLMQESARLSLWELLKISPLGFFGGIVSGIIMAVMFGLLPVWAKDSGLNVSEVGTFMAVMIFGAFLFQWPVGRWADRTDRRCVIRAISFLAAFFGMGLSMTTNTYWIILALGFFFGGTASTLYPLSMARTCERVHDSQIVAATGGFVLSYGIGAIAGPIIASFFMKYLGSHAIFYFLSGASAVLGLVAFLRPAPLPLK